MAPAQAWTTMARSVSASYRLLGLTPGADATAIKGAYRRLAKEMHPDVSQDPSSPDRFREVSDAYEVLMAALEAGTAGATPVDDKQGPAMRARWNIRRRHQPSEYPAWFKPPPAEPGSGERGLHTSVRPLWPQDYRPTAMWTASLAARSLLLARARRVRLGW